MKIIPESYLQYKIDGVTGIRIHFEVGDIFVNPENEYFFIKELGDTPLMRDKDGNEWIEKDFRTSKYWATHRWAGTISDDTVYSWEDAMPLND